MDKFFSAFVEEFGVPEQFEKADEATLEKYRGKLPKQLLLYWQDYGFCSFGGGLLSIVNPLRYEHALEAWVGDTKIVEQDAYYVIARGAFGQLYVWGTKTGYQYDIDPLFGWIYGEDRYSKEISGGKEDFCLQRFFAVKDKQSVDKEDEARVPLFARAVAKLGSLASDEMFTFTLPVFLGGIRSLENISKVNVHVQLDLLAQYGYREILDRDALARKAFG
jgi:hypothetical protein